MVGEAEGVEAMEVVVKAGVPMEDLVDWALVEGYRVVELQAGVGARALEAVGLEVEETTVAEETAAEEAEVAMEAKEAMGFSGRVVVVVKVREVAVKAMVAVQVA